MVFNQYPVGFFVGSSVTFAAKKTIEKTTVILEAINSRRPRPADLDPLRGNFRGKSQIDHHFLHKMAIVWGKYREKHILRQAHLQF
jgi:hypothetical protein